ncbi:MAG: hypothetical protein JSW33_00175 [bacterium]|nr:MAG: hypothetical protein JSW33_00175 [bacterium]
MTIYQAPTDEVKKIELPSAIQQVLWTKQMAAAGAKAAIEVFTRYVGSNSDLEIELSDHSGKKHGTIKSKISGNYYSSQIEVPIKAEKILYANVKLPKHDLEMKSNPLLVLPPIEITNLKWDKKEARRGDIVKLTADIKEVATGTEAEIEIYEHDADGAHDLITKFPVTVKNNKIELDWEYEYHEDTDDIPTEEESEKGYNPPEYFFRVSVGGALADSDLLGFKDWIEIDLKNQLGQPIPNEKYELTLPDGSKREGTLDDLGTAIEKDVPPGKCTIHFPDL